MREFAGLRQSARELLKGPPIYFSGEQAAVVQDQFLETVRYRGWELHGSSVMSNHFHAVVEAAAEVHSTKILGDLRGYASRALSRRWGKPMSGTWWTESGSRRPPPDAQALVDAVLYAVTRQHRPLVVWYAPQYANLIAPPAERGASAP